MQDDHRNRLPLFQPASRYLLDEFQVQLLYFGAFIKKTAVCVSYAVAFICPIEAGGQLSIEGPVFVFLCRKRRFDLRKSSVHYSAQMHTYMHSDSTPPHNWKMHGTFLLQKHLRAEEKRNHLVPVRGGQSANTTQSTSECSDIQIKAETELPLLFRKKRETAGQRDHSNSLTICTKNSISLESSSFIAFSPIFSLLEESDSLYLYQLIFMLLVLSFLFNPRQKGLRRVYQVLLPPSQFSKKIVFQVIFSAKRLISYLSPFLKFSM